MLEVITTILVVILANLASAWIVHNEWSSAEFDKE